jgi:hypothetical protein
MKRLIQGYLKKQFPIYFQYKAFKVLVLNQGSYLHQTGWLKSLKEERPIDRDGAGIPWMNYSVIKFLEKRLTKDLDLFEFGSGYSTSFYARLVKSVTSVEHDEIWHQRIKEKISANVELIKTTLDHDGVYCRTVNASHRKYDVVIVDGRDRVNCIKQSVNALSEKGVILLDDSQHEKYSEGIAYARENGFLNVFFEGLKPCGNATEQTTILYRRNNCLGL